MKRILTKLTVAMITFTLGMASTLVWNFQRSATPQPCFDCIRESESATANIVNEDDAQRVVNAFQKIPFNPPPDSVDEAYFLKWMPSFNPPVTVVVWRSGLQAFMSAKTVDEQGPSRYRQEIEINNRPLTNAEWCQLTMVLNQTSFWYIPSTLDEVAPEDGAVWFVEGFRHKQYRWAMRRVPEPTFANLCQYLIRLSGLETTHDLYLPQYLLR